MRLDCTLQPLVLAKEEDFSLFYVPVYAQDGVKDLKVPAMPLHQGPTTLLLLLSNSNLTSNDVQETSLKSHHSLPPVIHLLRAPKLNIENIDFYEQFEGFYKNQLKQNSRI